MKDNKTLSMTCVGHKNSSVDSVFIGIHYTHVIHYVLSGKGFYEVGGDVIPLSEGQLFFIRQGEKISYYSDKNDVYTYRWIGLKGKLADALMDACIDAIGGYVTNPIDGIGEEFVKICEKYPEYKQLGYQFCNPDILRLFSMVMAAYPKNENNQNDYATDARDYILANLCDPKLKVNAIADEIGVSRSALFRVFTEKYKVSPMQFINSQRIQLAKQLLIEGMRIKDVAFSCGYDNQLYFSTVFKNSVGITPSEYRSMSHN